MGMDMATGPGHGRRVIGAHRYLLDTGLGNGWWWKGLDWRACGGYSGGGVIKHYAGYLTHMDGRRSCSWMEWGWYEENGMGWDVWMVLILVYSGLESEEIFGRRGVEERGRGGEI